MPILNIFIIKRLKEELDMGDYKIKNYTDCYLYKQADYAKNIYKFFIESEVIDKNTEAFEAIKFDVRRLQPSATLTTTLESPNVVLLKHSVALPRSFKVFANQDIKSGDKKMKVFIDMSDIISTKGGTLTVHPSNIDKLISYLTSALVMRIYYTKPEILLNRASIIDTGTKCFAELFSHVVDYLRMSGVEKLKEKTMYIASVYYQTTMLGKEFSPSIESRCKQLSKLSTRDIEILNIQLKSNTYNNIETLINSIAKVIRADGLKLDNFLNQWLKLYGSGTQFALEYYPAFSSMLTNVYNGSYLVTGQKVVEKICGKDLVEYTNKIFDAGRELQ